MHVYDRSTLRAAASLVGDTNANRVAIRLSIGRATAHRLWNGTARPSVEVAAAVQRAYCVPTAELLIEREPAA